MIHDLNLFFSFRSDCIELDFKEISYLVLLLNLESKDQSGLLMIMNLQILAPF